MSKKPFKIAAVGAGYFSRFQYEAWSRLGVEIAGVCSRTTQSAQAISDEFGITGVFTDFSEMLDTVTPDLVDIITPPETHLDYISKAAKRGIPMICQKPFTRCLEEAEKAVQIAEDAGVLLIVHENFRFQPWYTKIRSMVQGGEVGEFFQVTFRLRPGDGQGPEAYLDRQPYFQKMDRFLVHETAIHLVDVFRYLFGEVASVTAELSKLNPIIEGEDAGLIIFKFKSGAQGVFDGNRLCDHQASNRRLTMGEMLVEGSKGAIRLNGDGEIFFRNHGDNLEQKIIFDWENKGFGGDCVYLLQRHVIDYLSGGSDVMNIARDYLINLRIEDAVYQSNRVGSRVIL